MNKIKVATELTLAVINSKMLDKPCSGYSPEETDMDKADAYAVGQHIANLFNAIFKHLKIEV